MIPGVCVLADFLDSVSLMKERGTTTFPSSATSSAVSCADVAPASHCSATWNGAQKMPASAIRYLFGSLEVKASVSVTRTESVACSTN